ncbi:MAG: SAM-dependent methyltransferase [Actinobacteria bacterium]|nr:SAM-dependent methyltransferase [Actinomycetota bacterium]
MTTPLETLLAEQISAHGRITFADFMESALYHPTFGYYIRGPERSGWGGHFITSPQLDPAFAELWARAFRQVWVAAGEPARFDIIEAGPGEGGFASALLDHLSGESFSEAVHLTLIERSPVLRERQRQAVGGHPRVQWRDSVSDIPPAPCGCFMANEVLDNQPVHLLELQEGAVVELFVTNRNGTLLFEAGAPSSAATRFLERHPAEIPFGGRIEISPAAEDLILEAAGKIRRGVVVFVDYGAERAELTMRPDGSLVCYSERGTDLDPLANVGEKDLTVFADWTVARDALERAGLRTEGPIPQAEVLRALGARSIGDRLRGEHDLAIEEKRGADAIRAISRRQALGALLDAGGLGGQGVMAGFRDLPEMTLLRR